MHEHPHCPEPAVDPFNPPRDGRNGIECLLAELLEQMRLQNDRIDDLEANLQSFIHTTGARLMATIQQYAERISAHLDRIDTNVEGINGDITGLKDEIAALRTSLGQLTPEQEALLGGLETRVASMAERVQAINDLTPPVVPGA